MSDPGAVKSTTDANTSGEFAFSSPEAALAAILAEVRPVGTERCELAGAAGRVLAEPVLADRPSPACDVSSMDGYAVRLGDLGSGELVVGAHARIGREPAVMPEGAAVHIVTGAPVPAEAEAVIRREDVVESAGRIALRVVPEEVRAGANIRRAGENLAAGEEVVSAGREIGPSVAGALSMFGLARPSVFRRVRVGVLVTGDEVLPADSTPTPWQLRDANGPTLAAMLARGWSECEVVRVADEREALERAVRGALQRVDALVLTGGVSMGDRDFVPEVLAACGCRVLLHRLPQRPGKPMLAAVADEGRPVFGLPGNPVSVAVTARRYALPALARRAGMALIPPPQMVTLDEPDAATVGLWWFRLARLTGPGRVALVGTRGSGDIPSAARADGFVEVSPGCVADGRLPFFGWDR